MQRAVVGGLALTLCLLSACGDGEVSAEAKDASIEEYAKAEVRKLLRDPSTAEFTEVAISRKAGVPAVCGKVNSHNGFGGKTGFQRFVGGGATVLEEQMADGEMDKVWAKLC